GTARGARPVRRPERDEPEQRPLLAPADDEPGLVAVGAEDVPTRAERVAPVEGVADETDADRRPRLQARVAPRGALGLGKRASDLLRERLGDVADVRLGGAHAVDGDERR